MRTLGLFLFQTVCLAASAAEPAVQMKAFRVCPSDLYVTVDYTIDTDAIEKIRVNNVMPGSLAEQSGIRKGDVLTAINGASVVGKKRSEVCRDGKVIVRGELTFVGHRGFFRKDWSITVQAGSLKEKNGPPEPAAVVVTPPARLEPRVP